MAACEVGKEAVWLRKLLSNLFEKPLSPTVTIKMSEDPVFHARRRHINNRYHYIRSLVQDGIVKLQNVLTDEQVTNVLTKSLPNKKFEYLRSMLVLVDITDFVNERCLEET